MIIANTSIVRISFIIMHGHASYFFKVIRSRLTTYSNTIVEKMNWYFGDLGLNVRLVSFVVTILAALLILYTPFGSSFLAPGTSMQQSIIPLTSDCCWTGPWEMHTLLQFLFTLCIFYLNKKTIEYDQKQKKKPHSQLIVWKICIPSWGNSVPYNHNS